MDTEQVKRLVLETQVAVEARRKILKEAHKELQEVLDAALSAIDGLPPGVGMLRSDERLIIAPTDGNRVLADPLLEAWVELVVTDEDTDGERAIRVKYNMVSQNDDSGDPREYGTLEDMIKSMIEPLIEDCVRLRDRFDEMERRISGPQTEASAPPDEAAQKDFTARVIRDGEETEVEIRALTKTMARDQLKKDGCDAVLEIHESSESSR